jgi:hypothetical protein
LKLTIQAVAKMTGLSESTVRQHAWQKKLGKLEGRTKVFTLAEAKKLGVLKSTSATKQKRKKPATRRPITARQRKPTPSKGAKESSKTEQKQSAKERRSFWGFLGIGRKPKTKGGLMQASIKK